VLSLLGLTACGGGSDTSTTGSNGSRYGSPSTEPKATGDASAGKVVFTLSCGSCHTLAAAGTSSDAGPNLDELALSDSTIADKVTNGVGGMPAFDNELSPQQIADVAAYVSSVAGG
jgi:mono/diheme cytochrome c family protein